MVGGSDRAVPPTQARRVRALVPHATIVRLRNLGHLAHEEDPQAVARIVDEQARLSDLLPGAEEGPVPH
jgi:magnesium chelatase accessory protein